jgi:hypothetical protein
MFVFAHYMGIRNWVKILLASTSLPPFTTAKKTWSNIFAILFLKCILNWNTYLWKKRMPKYIHYYPKYGVWRLGQGNASVRRLAPPPIRICVPLGKIKSGIPNFYFLEKRFHLQYLPTKKKTSKANNVSSVYIGSKIQPKISSVCMDTKTSVCTSVRQRKLMKASRKFLFAVCSWLKFLPTKKKHVKSSHYCPKYEGSKQGQKIAPICIFIHTLAPPLVCISIRREKTVRGFSDLFSWTQFYF